MSELFIHSSDVEKTSTLHLAESIGNVISYPNIPTVQEVKPKEKKDALPNSLSSRHEYDEFPLHSDMAHMPIPPRYMLLRAIVPSQNVATTYKKIAHCGLNMKKSILNPKTHHIKRLVAVEEFNTNETIYRWDESLFEPVSSFANEFQDWVRSCKKNLLYLCQSGDFILLDNWKTLHGRTSVDDGSTMRKLERVYLKEINDEWKSRVVN